MKSTSYYIPASGINSSIQEVDVSLFVDQYIIDGDIVSEQCLYYPAEIRINNSTGCNIGFVTLSNDREKEIFLQKPEWYHFIPIPNGLYTINNFTEKTKIIIFKRLDTVQALKGIIMHCIGYRK